MKSSENLNGLPAFLQREALHFFKLSLENQKLMLPRLIRDFLYLDQLHFM
jgi:hypothetical protein